MTGPNSNAGAAYLDEVFRSFRGYKRLAEGALAQVRDDEFFRLLGPEDNSVAIVVKHVAGNLRSRFTDFLASDGEKPDRHRDDEFIMQAGAQPAAARAELMQKWEAGWTILFDTLASLNPGDLDHIITIRGQEHTVLQALNRALTHYAYHIGQLAFLGKHFRGAEWKSLSIPKGQSDTYGRQAEQERAKSRE